MAEVRDLIQEREQINGKQGESSGLETSVVPEQKLVTDI